MHIRPYEAADFAGLDVLWREAFPNDPPRNRAEQSVPAKLAMNDDLLFVAVEDGKVIGSIMAGYDGHRGWLYSVAVRQSAKRRGIGTALVETAEGALRRLGCIKINLQVRSTNAAVIEFYKGLGFTVEEHISMGRLL
ncbi:GNAT family acetyltransferase [Novosphingobium sp. PASSN1]|uniref:GNAT family acetyltransferase n=1 Tax=Novosphingobium sp. PASSN1 TaxID=2015561 RepID=UPI000BD84D2C|nr:GNAT family acetyltransferase [Novosphingobium sp. PASSN1]OYU36912.1 MAG: GNAT family acetyltransferase [Novosphingobium sp. PASSN1]